LSVTTNATTGVIAVTPYTDTALTASLGTTNYTATTGIPSAATAGVGVALTPGGLTQGTTIGTFTGQ